MNEQIREEAIRAVQGKRAEDDPALSEDERRARAQIAELAATVTGNRALRFILRKAKRKLREQVYEMIVPHLKFRALPYEDLMR